MNKFMLVVYYHYNDGSFKIFNHIVTAKSKRFIIEEPDKFIEAINDVNIYTILNIIECY